jgi:hypothetical protein
VVQFILEVTMKKVYLLLVLPVFACLVFAEKAAVFPGYSTPAQIAVDDHHIYIVEEATISVHSLKDFKLEKKFGRMGEGPQEFKSKPSINVQSDVILVNSAARVSFFSKDGIFLKEVNHIVSGSQFVPLGKQFIGYNLMMEKDGKRYSTVNLYDSKFRKIKEVCRKESITQPGKGWKLFSKTYLKFLICDNKIFTAGDIDFIIDVFDANGEKLFSINQAYERIKFSAEHAKKVLDYYKFRPTTRPDYEWWEKNIHFPHRFPAIRSFTADHDAHTIYVRTYKQVENKSEFFVFAADGKHIKTVLLPIAQSAVTLSYPYMRDSAPYYIKNGKLYQLILDENTETYELHVTAF